VIWRMGKKCSNEIGKAPKKKKGGAVRKEGVFGEEDRNRGGKGMKGYHNSTQVKKPLKPVGGTGRGVLLKL